MNFKSVLTYLSATGLIALITTVLYFWGYLYNAAFFGYFSLSLSLFNLPHEFYLLSAWERAFTALACLCMGLFLYRLVRWTGTRDGDFKSFGRRFPRFTEGLRSCVMAVGPNALALSIFLLLTYVTIDTYNRGRQDARSVARSKREVQFERFGGDLKAPLYFLAYASGKYVVYTRPDEQTAAQVYVLNEAEVGRVSFSRP